MAAEGVEADDLLRLGGQAIESVAQVDGAASEVDLGAGGEADHTAPFIACSTRRNAFSLTCASTRTSAPLGRAISIVPTWFSRGPLYGGGCSGAGSSVGPSSVVLPMMPTGMNSTDSFARIAAAAFHAARQL